MNNIKRVLSVMLVVMLMSVSFAVPAFATDDLNGTPGQSVDQQQEQQQDDQVQNGQQQDDQQQGNQQQEDQQQGNQQLQTTNFKITITMPEGKVLDYSYDVEAGKSKYVSLEEMLAEKGLTWKNDYSVDSKGSRVVGVISNTGIYNLRFVYAGEKGKNPFYDVICGVEMVGMESETSSSAEIFITDKKLMAYYVCDMEEKLDGSWQLWQTRLHTGDGEDESKLSAKYGETDKSGYLIQKRAVKVGEEMSMVMAEKEGYIRRFSPVLRIHFSGRLNSEFNGNGNGNYTEEWEKGETKNQDINWNNTGELAKFGYTYDATQNTFITNGAERSLTFMPIAYNYLTLIRPVHFDANGGQGTITSVKAYTGAKVARHIDGCKYDADGNKTTEKADEADGMTRDGYKFIAWNTKADGSGTSYEPGEFFVVPAGEASYTLYAQWESNAPNPPIIIPVDPNPPVVIEDDDTPQDETPDVVDPVEEEVINDEETPLADEAVDDEAIIDDEETPLAENNSDSPKTGDSNNVPLWIALLLVSALGAGGAAYRLKRKEK